MLQAGDTGGTLRWLSALTAGAGLLLCTSGLALTPAAAAPPVDEVRALWVQRTSLASPQSIAVLIRSAREHGFNTLLVQVRGRGDAYYNDALEPRAEELQRQEPDFDPLQTVLTAAHAAGLRVHAWVNLNLVSSAIDLPVARGHLVHRRPEWLMVPRDLARDLAKLPARKPAYVARLSAWTRARPDQLEGLYTSPVVPGAVDHLQDIVRDLTRRYAVDGLHFDYARYPDARFDYSRLALAEFRTTIRPRLGEGLRKRLDARSKRDPLAYADGLPDDWRTFRVARMTALMRRLRAVVRAERPEALVTMAAKPELREAYDDRLQDWGAWMKEGVLDVVCPMAYTTEAGRFAEQIAGARVAANGRPVWAGIGAYRLSPSQTVANIRTARRLGAAGVILFSYDSLSEGRLPAADYLAQVARDAFAPVPLPPVVR
jgi:uncharacterized lipoprotein YddW (UPF0748 family)